ncbi:MAG: 5,6-dimethylbenzimidazole synthase [Paracoccaceae bacterium]
MQFGPELREGLDQLFKWRRDVRRFVTDPVCPDLVDRLLTQADTAPSVGLSQPWRWVLVQDPGRRAAVRANFETANAVALASYEGERRAIYAKLKLAGLDKAPVHLAVFCDETTQQGASLGAASMPEMRRYSCVSAITQLWLAARVEGLGLGWVSILDPDQINRDLEVPDTWTLIGYLCLGHPEEAHEDPELERAGWETRRAAPVLTR